MWVMSAQIALYQQEIRDYARKVESAVQRGDIMSVEFFAYSLLTAMLKALAHINGMVFVSFTSFLPLLPSLRLKPVGFTKLSGIITSGKFESPWLFAELLGRMTKQFEKLLTQSETMRGR